MLNETHLGQMGWVLVLGSALSPGAHSATRLGFTRGFSGRGGFAGGTCGPARLFHTGIQVLDTFTPQSAKKEKKDKTPHKG